MIPIQTAVSARECALMTHVAAGQRVVEAGALLGFSTVVLSAVAAALVSIDKHEGYGPPTWAAYSSNLQRFASCPVLMIRADACLYLPTVPADVAFIDLTGQRDLTARALAALHPSVQTVLVHDLGRQSCDGVYAAIRASAWGLVDAVDTLGVLRRSR